MRKFNFFCSWLLVITIAIGIITLGLNLTLRISAPYTFYFNDTHVVSYVSGEYVNSEMSDMIAGFMNSWNPDEFQIYEDTGYAIEGIFDKIDSHNMLIVKHFLDISFIFCVISIIISVAIYRYFLKNNYKEVLRDRFKVASVLTILLVVFEGILLNTKWGLKLLYNFADFLPFSDKSALVTLLGDGFISIIDNFIIGLTVIIFLVTLYATHILTKQPRIFY